MPINNNTSTTKTTPETQTLQKRRLQEENGAPVVIAQSKILDFHSEDSPRSKNNASNKVITSHNQLRSDLRFLP
jgi:hypothetical protein